MERLEGLSDQGRRIDVDGMKSALYDIQSDDDKREAQQEGFYGDLKFLQGELKRRFQTF